MCTNVATEAVAFMEHVSHSHRAQGNSLSLVLGYLPAKQAIQSAAVALCWQVASASLDAKELLLQCRPHSWLPGSKSNCPCLDDPLFCRTFLQDWGTCLADFALQLAFVGYGEHLIFVDPDARLGLPPQGLDRFPIEQDGECCITSLLPEKLWCFSTGQRQVKM